MLTRGSISLEKLVVVVAAIGAQTALVEVFSDKHSVAKCINTHVGGQPVTWEQILKFKADFGS